MNNKDEGLDSVGYGRPPRHSRWQPGQSGNPKGRPKTSRDADTLLRNALLETVTAKENGRAQKMTTVEAILTRLVNNAAMGDHRSIKLLLRLIDNLKLFKTEKRRQVLSSQVAEGLMQRLCYGTEPIEKAEEPIKEEVLSVPPPASPAITEAPAATRTEGRKPSSNFTRKESEWLKPPIIGHRLNKRYLY